jgi:hypothetical protein
VPELGLSVAFLDQKLADIARRFRHDISTLIRLSPKV